MNDQLGKFVDLVRQASSEDSLKVKVRSRVLASISSSTASGFPEQIAIQFLVGSLSLALVTIFIVSLVANQEPPLEMIAPFVSNIP